MTDPLVVLKQDVVVEPLVERWHAWAHLVSPATASLNVLYRHIALLDSFVAAPQVHAAACKNPSLRGGPFVDLPQSDVPAVKQLIEDTRKRQASQIAFAEALKEAYDAGQRVFGENYVQVRGGQRIACEKQIFSQHVASTPLLPLSLPRATPRN